MIATSLAMSVVSECQEVTGLAGKQRCWLRLPSCSAADQKDGGRVEDLQQQLTRLSLALTLARLLGRQQASTSHLCSQQQGECVLHWCQAHQTEEYGRIA